MPWHLWERHFTTQHSVLLKRYTQEVRLAYDSDGAGQKAALRAIPILKSAGINVRVIHMNPYKDPDEFIKNLGTEAFRRELMQLRAVLCLKFLYWRKIINNQILKEELPL